MEEEEGEEAKEEEEVPASGMHPPPKHNYLRLLSYMLLDWAQILKGSGFFWMVPSAGGSWGGRPGSGWAWGGGGAAAAVSVARACEA